MTDMSNYKHKANDALFDEVEKDVQKAEDFVKTQLEKANMMNEEANNLI